MKNRQIVLENSNLLVSSHKFEKGRDYYYNYLLFRNKYLLNKNQHLLFIRFYLYETRFSSPILNWQS